MKQYNNNEVTQFIEDRFFTYDFENEELPCKEDMEKINPSEGFLRYVHINATRCGYSGEKDAHKLAKFISEKSKAMGAEISVNTLKNWMTRMIPSNNEGGRENVYRLCFALNMNAEQTAEFFLKAYLERPFNYKVIKEAVYFFCMNNGYDYSYAQELIKKVKIISAVDNKYADDITVKIGERLKEITTESEFLKYLEENLSGFVVNNKTAIEKIEQFIESCKVVAPKEYVRRYRYLEEGVKNEINVDTIDDILNVIYDYSARETFKGKNVFTTSISDSNFPAMIRKNWPQRQQFENIIKRKNVSYDVIRRALIILCFYDFMANATVNDALQEGVFDEFVDEINTVLSECGYVQLYWRNPFDWMIGYCAASLNPLDTFRELIDEYYFTGIEEYVKYDD